MQQTDQDASVSRLSAVELGYLEDPFAELFVNEGQQAQREGGRTRRRFPIINRGKIYVFGGAEFLSLFRC